jgi:predicted nucleic acid-binding protein
MRRRNTAIPSAEEERLTRLLTEAIRHGQVAMIGPIRQELLSGIKEQPQFEKIKLALQAFRDETLDASDYEEAARLYNLCRNKGAECGPVDMLICAVAARRRWAVLAHDAGMSRFLRIVGSQTETEKR